MDDRKIYSVVGTLGAAIAAAAIRDASDAVFSGPSRKEREAAKAKRDAKAERESWPAKPETRQQRRARERREAKRASRKAGGSK